MKLQGDSTTACADLQSFQEAEALLACAVRYAHVPVLFPFRQHLIFLRQADVVFRLLCCMQCRSGQESLKEAGAPSDRTPTPGTVPHGMPVLLTHSLLLVCTEDIYIRPAIFSIMGCWPQAHRRERSTGLQSHELPWTVLPAPCSAARSLRSWRTFWLQNALHRQQRQ